MSECLASSAPQVSQHLFLDRMINPKFQGRSLLCKDQILILLPISLFLNTGNILALLISTEL